MAANTESDRKTGAASGIAAPNSHYFFFFLLINSVGGLFIGRGGGWILGSMASVFLLERFKGHHVIAASLSLTAACAAFIPLINYVW
jgi:Ni/Fe-hydrogenase subunit HybB-like protein